MENQKPMDEPVFGISPTEYRVLVRPDKVEEKTRGGIYRPQHVMEMEQAAATTGVLVAVSPIAFTYSDWPAEADKPKLGQRVAFDRHIGMSIKGKDGVDYRLLNDRDIWATLWEQTDVTGNG